MTVPDALAARYEEVRTENRLHAVPPHVVDAVIVDGRRAVLKRDVGPRGSAGVEGRVLRLVGARTALPVPEVLAVGPDWFLAAHHPDAPAPEEAAPADEACARPAGRALARLHADAVSAVEGYGALRVGVDGSLAGPDHDRWHDAALAFVHDRRPLLAEHGHADVAAAVEEWLAATSDAFAGAGGPTLCHGWFGPEHAPVEAGRLACIVDFEHALAAPPAFDVTRTELFVLSEGAREPFRAGYGAVRSLGNSPRDALAVLHGVYCFESLYVQNRHDPAETAERARRLRRWTFDLLDDAG